VTYLLNIYGNGIISYTQLGEQVGNFQATIGETT